MTAFSRVRPPRAHWDSPEGIRGRDLLTGRDVAKFGAMVGLLGILFDAAIGHGLTVRLIRPGPTGSQQLS